MNKIKLLTILIALLQQPPAGPNVPGLRAGNEPAERRFADTLLPQSAGGEAAAVSGPSRPQNLPEDEFVVITKAAGRNNCRGEDFLILLAIRKAEDGRAGREFGVMHPEAIDTDLDTQAGWAAATIVRNRVRWAEDGRPCDFIEYLGQRYAPPEVHPLNRNWAGNVKYWFNEFVVGSS